MSFSVTDVGLGGGGGGLCAWRLWTLVVWVVDVVGDDDRVASGVDDVVEVLLPVANVPTT
jgi:hypothetical protein